MKRKQAPNSIRLHPLVQQKKRKLMRPKSPASLSPDTSKIDPTVEQLQYQLTSINLSTLPLFESFPTIEQLATAETHSMPTAYESMMALALLPLLFDKSRLHLRVSASILHPQINGFLLLNCELHKTLLRSLRLKMTLW
jgi:hypothetical protein